MFRAVIEDSDAQSSLAPTPTIHVRFMLPLSVNFGDSLVLCGESPELGSWDPLAAPAFTWSSQDIWILDAELPASTSMEFKVVHMTSAGEVIWEYTRNRVIDVPSAEIMKDGEVRLTWCDEAAEVAKPKMLSSMASWDEEDGSVAGGSSMPFGNLFGFMSREDETKAETVDEAEEEVIEEVIEDAVEEVNKGDVVAVVVEDVEVEEQEALIEEEIEAVTEAVAEAIVEESPAATTTTATTTSEEETLSKEAKSNAATAKAIKNVTTAGMVLAGIGGAAALAGIAFDAALVDTVRGSLSL